MLQISPVIQQSLAIRFVCVRVCAGCGRGLYIRINPSPQNGVVCMRSKLRNAKYGNAMFGTVLV